MNSLNYVGAIVNTAFYKATDISGGEKHLRTFNKFGVAWGFQRNFQKRFSLDMSFGLGYFYAKEGSLGARGQNVTKWAGQITNVGQISLGLWLNRRK